MKQNPTILLIDDDHDDQEIFGFALEKIEKTVNCVFANDGLHALEKISNDPTFIPDFIFLDMNMPRMNGQQCLAEIKKIDRLKDVPVYMYSTSADPVSIEENKKLGAVDVIIKPSDIGVLAGILNAIIRNKVMTMMLFCIFTLLVPQKGFSQKDSIPAVKELKKLSVEELMNVMVTSVSKTPEKLSDAASAIQVVTGEEIKRSTTTRLPAALRMCPNVQLRTSGAHSQGVTVRGFNGSPVSNSSLSDKLLVMIDGRTVYTPLFGGVFWDVQNVMLEDLKQIEVVSGPGGALWGANAVNGIVNVITKDAKETQGGYVSGAAGNRFNDFITARYGFKLDSNLYMRVYGQRFDLKSSVKPDGSDAGDAWNLTQGGFRMDYLPEGKNTFTLQGDVYAGKEDDAPSTVVNGQNLLARWSHSFTETSGLIIQTYFDRTFRNIQSQLFSDELMTYDVDIQHNFSLGKRNKLVWGIGYRAAQDNTESEPGSTTIFTPSDRTLQSFSGFVQDQIAIVPAKLELTLGTKALNNYYTGWEFHPTVRLAWTPTEKHTLWTAVSQAVRTPTRFDRELSGGVLGSFGDFQSENVTSYEMGYRSRPAKNISFSVALFFNEYTDLRSIDTNYNSPPAYYFANNYDAETYGVEFSANIIATNWWKIRGGYTYIKEHFTATSDNTFPKSYLFDAIDPYNQFLVQSVMDLGKHFQLDGIVRYVDVSPENLSGTAYPAVTTFDLRFAYLYKWLTLSVSGLNLADKSFKASDNVKTSRSVFGKIEITF